MNKGEKEYDFDKFMKMPHDRYVQFYENFTMAVDEDEGKDDDGFKNYENRYKRLELKLAPLLEKLSFFEKCDNLFSYHADLEKLCEDFNRLSLDCGNWLTSLPYKATAFRNIHNHKGKEIFVEYNKKYNFWYDKISYLFHRRINDNEDAAKILLKKAQESSRARFYLFIFLFIYLIFIIAAIWAIVMICNNT